MPVAYTIRYCTGYCLIPADLLQVVVSFDAYVYLSDVTKSDKSKTGIDSQSIEG